MTNHEMQGYRAFQKGIQQTHNPYPQGSALSAGWLNGWRKAHEEHKAWVKYLVELDGE